MLQRLITEQPVSGDPAAIWDFFSRPQNLNELTPPQLRFRIVGEPPRRMYAGLLIEYRVRVLPGVWTRWVTEIPHVREGEYFVDEQRIGPYRLWHHEHHFTPTPGGVLMTDRVTYDIGWGMLGRIAGWLWVDAQVARIFDYRATRIQTLFPGRPGTPVCPPPVEAGSLPPD